MVSAKLIMASAVKVEHLAGTLVRLQGKEIMKWDGVVTMKAHSVVLAKGWGIASMIPDLNELSPKTDL